jgi:hypothetical protein
MYSLFKIRKGNVLFKHIFPAHWVLEFDYYGLSYVLYTKFNDA